MPPTDPPLAEISDAEEPTRGNFSSAHVARLLSENARLRENNRILRAQAITDRKDAHYYKRMHGNAAERRKRPRHLSPAPAGPSETFVELERFTGACYRAANWIEVGTTKGRGKLEKNHQSVLPLKNILLYPLQKNFRAILAG